MAQPTPAEFKAEYAEFRLASDTVVQAKLDAAYRRVGESFGDVRDDAAKLYAAHLIAMSPLAEPSRKSVSEGGGRTQYLDEFERLAAQVRIWGTAVTTGVPQPAGD
jgi:gamma-glutamyl:cysteine ligase YbdK (ATP-grasp superfamily)